MCGLVGMAGNLYIAHNRMFRDMMVFNTVRGFDSAGVAYVGMGNAGIEVVKEVGAPQNMWDWGLNEEHFDNRGILKTVKKVILGHNRAATLGVVNQDNAHPFTFDHITGTHNGSLYNWGHLEGATEFDVDSQAIFKTIADKGIEYLWSELEGDTALVWWDEKDKTINLIRNDGRPLYTVFNKDKSAIYYASEPWMITVAATRGRQQICFDWETKELLKPHHLYKYAPTTLKCPLVEVKELGKKQVYRHPIGGGTNGGFKPYVKKPKNKNKTMKNTNWANGTIKLGKETRGIEFVVEEVVWDAESASPYIRGVVKPTGERIEVIPHTLADEEKLRKYVIQKAVFRTKARVRQSQRYNKIIYRISSQNVVLVKCPGTHLPVKPDGVEKDKIVAFPLYVGHGNDKLSKNSWKSYIKTRVNSCCTSCGNPLDINDHKEIVWVKPTVALCPTCSEDPTIEEHLMGIGFV